MKNLKKTVAFMLLATLVLSVGCKKSETDEPAVTQTDSDKLLFNYKFSNNYRDSGPKAIHLDSSNVTGATFVNDRNSTANHALNIGGGEIAVPNSDKWKVSFPFTISMWVNVVDKSNADNRFFESDAISGSQYRGFWIHTTGSNGQVAFNFSDGNGTSRNTAISSLTLSNNTWHHLVGVYKGVNNIEVYFDGNRDTGATYDSSCDPIQYSATDGHIGAFYSLGSILTGKMDNVKTWGRALSADEVSDEYNAMD